MSERLWNAAYDSLETENAELVMLYVKTLETVLGAKPGVAPNTNISAELHNPTKRQVYMRRLVEEGQAKISRASKITNRVGDVARFVLSVRNNRPGCPNRAAGYASVGWCLRWVASKQSSFGHPFMLGSANMPPDSPESCTSDEIQPCRYRPCHLQNGLVLRPHRTSPEQGQHCCWQGLPSSLTLAGKEHCRAL